MQVKSVLGELTVSRKKDSIVGAILSVQKQRMVDNAMSISPV